MKDLSRVVARSCALIILFLSPLASHAAVDQVWKYTVNILSGQTFKTLGAAEAAMRGVSVSTVNLVLKTSIVSDQTISNSYAVPTIAATPLPWGYWPPSGLTGSNCASTEGTAVGIYESLILSQGQPRQCSYSVSPTSAWSAGLVNTDVRCGNYPYQREGRKYQSTSTSVQWNSELQIYQCMADRTGYMTFHRARGFTCPAGYAVDWSFNCVNNVTATITGTLTQYAGTCRGDPCNVATGDNIQNENDITGPLKFGRVYHSLNQFDTRSNMGAGWHHSYSAHLLVTNGQLTGAVSSTGYVDPLYKRPNTNNYVSYTESGIQVEPNGTDWILFKGDGSKENYDKYGQLQSIVDTEGNVTHLIYDITTGILEHVYDDFGHELAFHYSPSGSGGGTVYTGQRAMLTSVVDSAGGRTFTYSYMDAKDDALYGNALYGLNLVQVTGPDNKYRGYVYENPDFPNHLTGIIDENLHRFATFSYDAIGRAVSTEHAGGSEKVTLQYNADGTTLVTDAVGKQETFTFAVNGPGLRNVTGVSKDGAQTSTSYAYSWDNPQHRVTQSIDGLGRKTTFAYDTHHLTTKTEAAGTAQARTTTYQYLSEYNNRPTLISRPSVYTNGQKTKNITYNAAQLPTQITESGYTPDGIVVSRTVNVQYDNYGHVTQIDGPRTDVSDITTFEYYPNDGTSGVNRGQLMRVTNALGQVTTYDAYDGAGRLLQTTDANFLRTQYAYDARGRVTSLTKTPASGLARVTTYTYDAVGQLSTATAPDGIVMSYVYDDAHHLTSVTDNLGNKVQYSYDLKGRRANASTLDPNGTLVRSIDITYDAWDRISSMNNGGSIAQTVFDAVGELVSETNPKNATTTHQYDALARMLKTVDALAGNTGYSYDVNDRVTQVTAPNNAATQYSYDDLGRLTKEISPDRGTTVYGYDAAGNLLLQIDARNVTANYTYDALNRITSASYPTSTENITYSYDFGANCSNGIGKLCDITDASGTTSYGYDAFGNLTTQVHTELNIAYTTAYTYDNGDRILSITYPDGRLVSYTRDAIGRISSIGTTLNGVTTTVTSARGYSADGTLNSQTWGNGKLETRMYDLQGRLTELMVGTDTRSYTYDANGNVTQKVATPETGNYTYDALDRLTADNNGTNTTFGYDANGNRTLLGSTVNVYTANTNRVTQVGSTALTLDAAGNTLVNGDWTYTYNSAGALSQVTGVGAYVYNALRQRTRKTAGTATTVYHYDVEGHLIAETQPSGQLLRAYVYADDVPVAQIEPITVLPPDIIVDNTQATFTGTWPAETSIAGYYGANYHANTNGTGADKAVWTVNVPTSGVYQVYARWVAASSTHASNAPYTVDYSGGGTTITKSQRTSGGQWVSLGSYAFTDGTAGSVTLTDNADGTVIADAIKLVATSGGTTQEALRYLHTDHLDTPRLVTNEQGTIIWRWEGKAFGDTAPNQDPDGDTVSTVINLRYPGQYYDAESWLFYNWNRFYSPQTGRYLTSDPIGLEGGLNTYVYVQNNPLLNVDPEGLLGYCGMPGASCGPPPGKVNWYGRWCGPGGNGRTTDGVDCACKKHDQCYDACGLDAKTRWLTKSGLGSACALRCDVDLASNPSRNDCNSCNKQ